ncbi:MFS transporter [Holzapfeliella floricola]|nr:MFS transporter [Holzapfeliella floricola]
MKRNKTLILLVILVSYFMILLDNSIIFTGTVKIAEELHLTPIMLSWVNNAYALTFGGLLLVGGRLGDSLNRKVAFSMGLIIFGLGSLLVAISTTDIMMILSRAFQGVGSAILAPTTLSLLMENFEGNERTRAISAYGATAGIGASLGLVIGGLFASLLSWRDGFLINVPIAMVMLILTAIYVPSSQVHQKQSLDILGSIYSFVMMLSLIYGIVGENARWISILLFVIMLVLFIKRERNFKNPLVPLNLFTNKERLGAYIARFFYMGGMLSLWFLTPQMMQTNLGFTPLQAGIGFFPLTIVNFLVALTVSKLTHKFGNEKLLVVGIFITMVGVSGLILFSPSLGYLLGIALPMILMGVGQGLTLSPLTVSGVAEVNQQESGAASGLVNVFHQIGGSFGVSFISIISQNITDSLKSYHIAMIVTTTLIAIALVAVIILIYSKNLKIIKGR